MHLLQSVERFLNDTGAARLFEDGWEGAVKTLIMIAIAGVLIYLAIGRGFEPLLLLPIAVGMLLTNIPGVELFHSEWYISGQHSSRSHLETDCEVIPNRSANSFCVMRF